MMEEEIWKDIIIEKNGIVYDYSGLYQISNFGRIKNLNYAGTDKPRLFKPSKKDKDSYIIVTLTKNKEKQGFSVHRLVATAFVPNPDNLPIVNHKDENKQNNHADNLEWCTVQYNNTYGTRKERQALKISVRVICLETKQIFDSIKEAQEWLGKGGIRQHLRGNSKSAGKHPITGEPLHWMYYDEWLLENQNANKIRI